MGVDIKGDIANPKITLGSVRYADYYKPEKQGVVEKQTLELKTASGVINIAAAKRVVLAVSGGASITIEGGQFTAQCPGKITVKAGKKAMVGPGTMGWQMPTFPQSVCVACMLKAMKAGSPFAAPAGA